MSRSQRRRLDCLSCGNQFRTRRPHLIEIETCPDCVRNSVISNLSVRKKTREPGRLEWHIMREHWLHRLIYRNVAWNGMPALGFGYLKFVNDQVQNNDISMGRFEHKIKAVGVDGEEQVKTNIYDLLLKDADNRRICIELKRCAEDTDVPQFLRYLGAIQEESEKRGMPDPILCVITAQLAPSVLCALRPLWRVGVPIYLYQLAVKGDGFFLEGIGNEEAE